MVIRFEGPDDSIALKYLAMSSSTKLLALVDEYQRLRQAFLPANQPEHSIERQRIADAYANEVCANALALGMTRERPSEARR